MNTITANNGRTEALTETPGKFARMLRTLRIEFRRALELVGKPYEDGVMPPF
jgi:hypothetical protein